MGFHPIVLGTRLSNIFVCLTRGNAPLLLSKTFQGQFQGDLRASRSELHLPDGVVLPLPHVNDEHCMLQLDNFRTTGGQGPSDWIKHSRGVSLCWADQGINEAKVGG